MSSPTNDTPVLDLLRRMTADSVTVSSLSLEPDEVMLVRIAALAAVDAPPASYLANLEAIEATGIDADRVRGVLTAIAPIVGTPRVASATGRIVDALDVVIEVAGLEAQ
jgi:4-carboxymuconolactone decarboxylase